MELKNGWISTDEKPADGESIWVLIEEYIGDVHTDYGVVFYDTDGVRFRAYESDEFEAWPPADVRGWMPAKLPAIKTDDRFIRWRQIESGKWIGFDQWHERWRQIESGKWIGFDQWQEHWVVDCYGLKTGAMLAVLRDEPNNNYRLIDYFDNAEKAKSVAEYINKNRGNWNER